MGPVDESEELRAQATLGPVDKSEGLGGGACPGPVDKSEGLGGRAGPGPVDKSEELGGRAGPARTGTAKPLADTVHRGLARNIPAQARTSVQWPHVAWDLGSRAATK